VPPRHSSHPAKKARSRVPAVAATQNVFMRKLGVATSEHVESANFDSYLSLFNEGLSRRKGAVNDLFMEQPPAPAGVVMEEAE
jgi:hypothetical protein